MKHFFLPLILLLTLCACSKPENAACDYENICSQMTTIIEDKDVGQAISMPAKLVKYCKYYGELKADDFSEEQQMRLKAAGIKLREASHAAPCEESEEQCHAKADSIATEYENLCAAAIATIQSEMTDEATEQLEDLTFDLDREYEGLRLSPSDFSPHQQQRMLNAMLAVYSTITPY